MAIIINLSFLALVLVASSVSAADFNNVQDFCAAKCPEETAYCITMVRPLVSDPSQLMRSNDWLIKAREKTLQLSTDAQNFLLAHGKDVKKSEKGRAHICENKLRDSVGLINANDFDTSAMALDDCAEELEGSQGVLENTRVMVAEAAKASRVMVALFTHRG